MNSKIPKVSLGLSVHNGDSMLKMSLLELLAMQIASGNKNRIAALLKFHRDTLYRKLRKYELD